MAYIFDASFGHAQMTPQAVKGAGADGVILYAGCADTAKNTTPAEVAALLDAGLQVGLVIENVATDLIGGAPVGDAQGQAIVAAAKQLGYDVANCVLFTGYDTDSHEPADGPALLAGMEAFAKHVPVPGFYGDSDAIDFLYARHPEWIYWQSDSTSFSPKNPTPNAHLLQLYNDPRAHGLPVDVDTVEKPLPLMGAHVPLTDQDITAIKQSVVRPKTDAHPAFTVGDALRAALDNAIDLEALKASVAKISQTPAVDEDKIASLVLAKLAAKLSA